MTGKILPEQKVLKKLGIPDFRHLTKDKVIKLASMLDSMDPEVAKKALDQFPEFTKTASEMVQGYQDTIQNMRMSNEKSVESYYAACTSIIEGLQKQLEKDNLSFEEKKYIIEKMTEVAEKMGEKDSENKRFLFGLAGLAGTATLLMGGLLAAALGANTSIALPDVEEEEID